jgi:hypothetical protein
VRNVPDSAALAKQLGGKVWIELRPDLFDGKVAVIADPTARPSARSIGTGKNRQEVGEIKPLTTPAGVIVVFALSLVAFGGCGSTGGGEGTRGSDAYLMYF